MSSLFLMVTITDRRSTDAFLQLYQQRGVDVNPVSYTHLTLPTILLV